MSNLTKNRHICGVYQCETQNGRMYHFPNPKTQMQRFLDWLKACRNVRFNSLTSDEIYKMGYVCYLHFKDSDFIPCSDKKLHKAAVPSQYLPIDIEYSEPVLLEIVDLPNGGEVDKSLTDIDSYFDLPLKDLPFLQSENCSVGNKTIGRALDRLLDSKLSACNPPAQRKSGRKTKLKSTSSNQDVKSDIEPVQTLICRLCLCHTVRAFSILENPIITEMLESLTLIKIINSLVLPTVICLKCFLNLKLAFNIQQKFVKVEQTLQEKLKEMESVKPVEFDTNHETSNTEELCIDKPMKQKIETKNINLERNLKTESCPICEKKYKNLTKHLKLHVDPSCLCEICGIVLTPQDLSTHRYNNHKNVICKCNVCGKDFERENGKILHEAREHNAKPKYVCRVCGKRFFLTKHLKIHLEFTHLKKRFSCQICNASYRSSHALTIHQKSHSHLMQFECRLCEKRFNTTDTLRRHHFDEHNIAEDLNYKCDICEEMFISDRAVSIHRRVHY